MTTSSVRHKAEPRRTLALPVLVALSVAILPTPTVVPALASDVDQARQKLEAGELGEARRLAEAAVRKAPRNPQAHLAFGSVLLQLGDADQAGRSFEFALALSPELRSEIGEAHLAAMRHFAAESSFDLAETHLESAAAFDPSLREVGITSLFDAAFVRFRAGDAAGRTLLAQWLSRFPDHEPESEENLFALAAYLEAEGRLSDAARVYGRCAERFPEGELGTKAARLLQPRKVRIDRIVSAPCASQLFLKARTLELGLESTQLDLSLVWVSEDPLGSPRRAMHILPESKLVTASGDELPVAFGEGASRGREVELPSDSEHRLTLTFPPVARDQTGVDLVLENDVCGTTGRWGRFAVRLSNLPLQEPMGDDGGPSTPAGHPLAVHHIHDYFILVGRCSGSLSFSPDGIVYSSGPHSFELPCDDVLRVGLGSMEIIEDPLRTAETTRRIPTLLLEGRILTKRGKVKTETWHFVPQHGTPPVLLLPENLCPITR